LEGDATAIGIEQRHGRSLQDHLGGGRHLQAFKARAADRHRRHLRLGNPSQIPVDGFSGTFAAANGFHHRRRTRNRITGRKDPRNRGFHGDIVGHNRLSSRPLELIQRTQTLGFNRLPNGRNHCLHCQQVIAVFDRDRPSPAPLIGFPQLSPQTDQASQLAVGTLHFLGDRQKRETHTLFFGLFDFFRVGGHLRP